MSASAGPDHAGSASPLAGMLRRVLFLGAGLVMALLVAEIALRLVRLAPASGVATVTARDFERLPGIFAPNQHVRDVQKPALPYTVTIDSLGFRGAGFARAKPARELRVLMIGDSYVYGDFVDDNQTLPFQLEQRLRRSCPDVRVINAGLGGTTIVDQAFMLARTLPLDPDLVILVYVADDLENLAAAQPAWVQLAENRRSKSRFPLSLFYPIARKTALWNLALRVRATRVNRDAEASLDEAYARDSVETTAALRERYGDALLAFRDTVVAHGVPFVFVMFPAWRELEGPSENLVWIKRFAETHAVHGVNLLPALQATSRPADDLYLIPEDGHPSPLGHAVAADSLATVVLGGPVGPSSCGF